MRDILTGTGLLPIVALIGLVLFWGVASNATGF